MQHRRGDAMHRLARMQRLWTLQVSVSRRHRPIRIEVRAESAGVRVEPDGIDPPPLLIRLATVENRAFELPVVPEDAGGEHAEADVRGILPVMAERRDRIVHCRRAVHERHRAECRLAGWSDVRRDADAGRERALIHRRQLHPEIMGVLPVMQGLAPVALTALEKQRVTSIGDGRRVEAEHRSRLKAAAEEIAARHQHRPVE